MRSHTLKVLPPFFYAVSKGTKTFEIRKNDRGYLEGDVVYLQEYDKNNDRLTGRVLSAEIGFVYEGKDYGLSQGHCVFSLLNVRREKDLFEIAPVQHQGNA